MPQYAILIYPAANRVYADASSRLLRAELGVFSASVLKTKAGNVAEETLGGIGYVTFDTATPLTDGDIRHLSNLSTLYALFEWDGSTLRPLPVAPLDVFDSDLLTIQKYSGKTNELFTKLLLNVTVLASGVSLLDRPLLVLDPLCGRGTTLNQAMMYGFDATGLDADRRDFEAYNQFIQAWLKTKRIKHHAGSGVLRRDKVRLGRRLEIEYGPTKADYKAGATRWLRYFNCDTMATADLMPRGSADVIVTDAPYGIQHGSRAGAGLARSPRDLLSAALPVWTKVLAPGGAIGISWNSRVLPRAELVDMLAGAGLAVADGGPFEQFSHRVDQAIQRDLVIARKAH